MILTLAAFMICAGSIFARDVEISASVNRSTVAPGEEFTYTVTVGSDSGGSLPKPILPSFEEFDDYYGPSTSQSVRFVNGRMSRKLSYTMTLSTMKPGEYTIDPSTITVNGQTWKSDPVTITVTSPGKTATSSGSKPQNAPAPRASVDGLEEYLEGNLFLKTELEKSDPYVGEPLVVSYTLYARKGLPLTSWGFEEPQPQYKNFIKEELYTAERLSFREVKLDGETFNAALVKKMVLVPAKTGKTIIDPVKLKFGIRVKRSRSNRRHPFFNDPFFGDSFFDPFNRNTAAVSVMSSVRELDVKPLPTPKPENFSGTVGNYRMNAKVDRTEISMDELLTLSVRMQGQGAVEGIMQPELPQLEGFDLYETESSVDKNVSADQIGGSKIFDFVLRPTRTGDLEIPSIVTSIFNPVIGEYDTLKTDPVRVTVEKGVAREPVLMGEGVTRKGKDIVEINADINYIKRGAQIEDRQSPLIKKAWFLGLQMLPLLFVLGCYLIMRRRLALESDLGLARRIRAGGAASKRLKAASRAFSAGKDDEFYSELALAVRGFFGDKLNREAHGLTIEELEGLLGEKEIPEQDIRKVTELLENADAARYSPASHSQEEKKKRLEEARSIIREFDKRI